MNSAPVTTPVGATGFTEATLRGFLARRDEPSWLIERRREAFARFQAFPWPTARDEEWRRTDIRGFRSMPSRRRRPSNRVTQPASSLEPLWDSLSCALRHRHRAHQRRPVAPSPIPRAGRRGLRRPEPRSQGPSRAARALPADPGRHSRRRFFAALHAAFWTSGSLLYVPKGVTVEAPLFSLVGLAQEGRVDLSHTLVVLEDGAEATLVRESAGRDGRRGSGTARRGGRGLPGAGGAAPARQHPELGRGDLALQPRAGPRRPRRLAPVDRRRPGLAAGQGQPGGRAGRAGGQGAGQRRHVHDRPPAPRLFHPAGPRRPAHHQRPALQGGAQGPIRGSSGRG